MEPMESPQRECGKEIDRVEFFLELLRKKIKLVEEELSKIDQGNVTKEQFHVIQERRRLEAFLHSLMATMIFIEDAKAHGHQELAQEMEKVFALYSQI